MHRMESKMLFNMLHSHHIQFRMNSTSGEQLLVWNLINCCLREDIADVSTTKQRIYNSNDSEIYTLVTHIFSTDPVKRK